MLLRQPLPPIPPVQLDAALAGDPTTWEPARQARILLTGGTGFVGTWLLELFCRANQAFALGAEAWVLSRDPEGFSDRSPHLANDPAVHFLKGDFRSFPFPFNPFDLLIHAAVEYGSPLETLENNMMGSLRVFEFARHAGIKRVLFTSSGAVYGPQTSTAFWINEEAPIGSPWLTKAKAYGESKRATELLGCLHGEKDGFSFLIARGFAFLGPYLSLGRGSAAGNFIGDALMGRSIQVHSDGTALRSYLYGCDLAIWLWTILLRGKSGRPYNVGSEEAISIRDLALRIRDLVNPDVAVEFAQIPRPGNHPDVYVPSTARAKEELGLDAWTGLDSMIIKTAQWNKESGLSQI